MLTPVILNFVPLAPTWSQLTAAELQSLYPYALTFAGGGLAVGMILMWLILRAKLSTLRVRQEEEARASRRAIADLEAGSSIIEAELSELRSTEAILLKRQGELEAHIVGHQRRHAEQQSLFVELEKRFAQTFQTISQEALSHSQDRFLAMAKETFAAQQTETRGALDQRHLALEQLIGPVAQSLEKVQSRVGEMEAAREGAYDSLLQQVRDMAVGQSDLNQETRKLARALRTPTGHGQWGGIQLKRCVELAGMTPYCDFLPTASEGDPGPGMSIRLPAGQQIVVDTNAPMATYIEALESDEDAAAEAALQQHAQDVALHIAHLSSAKYVQDFDARPEFVVFFLPSESYFSSALQEDPSLVEKGIEQGVILATPTTLIALLRAISYGWRQEHLAENARQIATLGGDLYQRLSAMTDHFGQLGQSLETTVSSYNRAMQSLESNVLPEARKFEELAAPDSGNPLGTFPHLAIEPLSLDTGDDFVPKASEDFFADGPLIGASDEERFEGFDANLPEVTLEAPDGQTESKATAAADDLRAALGSEEK